MAYRRTYKPDIDAEVLRNLPVTDKSGPWDSHVDISDWNSISHLWQKTGLRVGTLRNSLKRLCEAGKVHRAWDGNERYGRYVYARHQPLNEKEQAKQ
ncbi:MAG TPA: hypothetical protein VEF34_13855 [Syntrophobacteraceae bacterium]|nr:hypothetical protein [Syntrophobacteraceae bacterium]